MGYFDRFNSGKYKGKNIFSKFWHFVWREDSWESWIVNIVLAFLLIKFIVYPGLGLVFGTTHPIVAVVSGSMEHHIVKECYNARNIDGSRVKVCTNNNVICGKNFDKSKYYLGFDEYWSICGDYYSNIGITKENFAKYPMHNGFNTGDIMFLYKAKLEDLKQGDIIVFNSRAESEPIIHRIVEKKIEGNEYVFTTKGDHNEKSYDNLDVNITSDKIIGKAFIRVPYLGYVKIWFVKFICLFNSRMGYCIA